MIGPASGTTRHERSSGPAAVKLVVFCPNWVGDAVMATPALRALRRSFPDAFIAGIVRPNIAETLAGNSWLDDTFLHHHRAAGAEHRTAAAIGYLRRQQFDVALLLTNSIRSALVALAGGVRKRIGYAHEGRGLLLSVPIKPPANWKTARQTPLVDCYLELAHRAGADTDSRQLELFTTVADESHAEHLWSRLGWTAADTVVVLNPGAAYGPAKRWPSRSFAELARRLVDERRAKVLVLCGPTERGFARYIADASLRPRQVHSMAEEEVSIGLAKAAVRRADLLVTTDSGPRHFGAAFGVPVVSLFGPTHIGWTETYYDAETKLQKQLPCGPCQQRECPLGHLRCMTELTVDLVYQAACRWLDRRPLQKAG